ncbi:ubiquinone biosynthesis protein UbiE [candidate division WOR-3 bacterium]|uniref:Ubiquinone biosynthesis protein UbiE n=1 Tax=candidate division WOR-3 bacterium TaxID=2052148 RepID=A0A660SM43_UNCW3|nr:MAG: ubiquinone biosynthesis protein UbiE [candidate division WOR-3 bacterium]
MNHREFFDRLAEGWDEEREEDEIGKIKELIEALKIDKAESILDVGTGTGILLQFLTENPIIGIDLSYLMLKRAKQKFPHRLLIQADAASLPFSDRSFDRAILFAVFPHLRNKLRALKELYRVLRPEGRIDILHSASREEINRFHQKIGGVIKEDFIPDGLRMTELLRLGGFQKVEIRDHPDHYRASGWKP